MKRNTLITVIIAVIGIIGFSLCALFNDWKFYLFLVIGCLAAFSAFLMLRFTISQNFHEKCGKLFLDRKFEEERALIEKKMKSPFFFMVRLVAIRHYIRVCMALDDLQTASRYIARLRHGGGKAWKYATAYCYILIKLDEGDLKTARREFEDFRKDCVHAEIYKTQLEVLTAIFSRLLSTQNVKPLPEAAVESSFPVVSRVLGRHYEEQASKQEWH